jgi:hypothetical protein
MKFVLFTYVGEQSVAEWEAMSDRERAAYVELHEAWFRAHGEHVLVGEELAAPATGRTIRRRRGVLSTTDGPFIETKELLGGFIVVEAPNLAAAVAMAEEWPTLGTDGNGIEVRPTDASG